MPRKRGKEAGITRDLAAEQFTAGVILVRQHPIFAPLLARAELVRQERNLCPQDGWAVVTRAGVIHVHPTRRGLPDEWLYVLAHCLLHLGFGHFQQGKRPREWNVACDLFVARFLADLKLGRPPEDMGVNTAYAARNEERLYAELCANPPAAHFPAQGTGGPRANDLIWGPEQTDWQGRKTKWPACFGLGLVEAVTQAVNIAGGMEPGDSRWRTPAHRARDWFINSYPLLGALAANFTIIEDAQLCYRMQISIAAVNAESRRDLHQPRRRAGRARVPLRHGPRAAACRPAPRHPRARAAILSYGISPVIT